MPGMCILMYMGTSERGVWKHAFTNGLNYYHTAKLRSNIELFSRNGPAAVEKSSKYRDHN